MSVPSLAERVDAFAVSFFVLGKIFDTYDDWRNACHDRYAKRINASKKNYINSKTLLHLIGDSVESKHIQSLLQKCNLFEELHCFVHTDSDLVMAFQCLNQWVSMMNSQQVHIRFRLVLALFVRVLLRIAVFVLRRISYRETKTITYITDQDEDWVCLHLATSIGNQLIALLGI